MRKFFSILFMFLLADLAQASMRVLPQNTDMFAPVDCQKLLSDVVAIVNTGYEKDRLVTFQNGKFVVNTKSRNFLSQQQRGNKTVVRFFADARGPNGSIVRKLRIAELEETPGGYRVAVLNEGEERRQYKLSDGGTWAGMLTTIEKSEKGCSMTQNASLSQRGGKLNAMVQSDQNFCKKAAEILKGKDAAEVKRCSDTLAQLDQARRDAEKELAQSPYPSSYDSFSSFSQTGSLLNSARLLDSCSPDDFRREWYGSIVDFYGATVPESGGSRPAEQSPTQQGSATR